MYVALHALTGSPTVTIPCSLTMLGWWNWPMMAASCRNFTFSPSGDSSFKVLMATSTGSPGECHTPLLTHPNCPEPSLVVVLQSNRMQYEQSWHYDFISILYLISCYLPESFASKLLIDTRAVISRCPKIYKIDGEENYSRGSLFYNL